MKKSNNKKITGIKPQSKLWKQIPQQAAGYYTPFIRDNSAYKLLFASLRSLSLITLRFAGLFNLPISLRFALGIGVSRINRLICYISEANFQKSISKAVLHCLTTFIFITLMISVGGCATMQTKETKDEISNLSFSHDGKKVLFDRCRDESCQIQVYDLETGELAAYQSPVNERWTMGKYSYDGKRITFSVIPRKPLGGLELGEMQITVMDADGKNLKKVTTGPGAKLYPTFSLP